MSDQVRKATTLKQVLTMVHIVMDHCGKIRKRMSGKIEILGRGAKAKVNQRETLELEIMVT